MENTDPLRLAQQEFGPLLESRRVLRVLNDMRSGSLVDLGSWVGLSATLDNPNLSELEKNFRGSESLFIECLWELHTPEPLLPPVKQHPYESTRMAMLRAIEGATIEKCLYNEANQNFAFKFDSGIELYLVPNMSADSSPAFTVTIGHDHWTVNQNGTVERETS